MSTINLGKQINFLLENDGVVYGASSSAVALAILDTVARRGITHQILAGVNVADFDRPKGRPRTKPPQTAKKIEYKYSLFGRAVTLQKLSQDFGIPISTIRNRINRGLSLQDALEAPRRGEKHEA